MCIFLSDVMDCLLHVALRYTLNQAAIEAQCPFVNSQIKFTFERPAKKESLLPSIIWTSLQSFFLLVDIKLAGSSRVNLDRSLTPNVGKTLSFAYLTCYLQTMVI